ncbi:MAG TPA: hypothetical protein VGI93_16155 [Steroidobacteraceae bacterium]
MSPLWRDEVSIYLGPRRLALARRTRGIKPQLTANVELALADTGSDTFTALERLAELTREAAWQNADARVVIADAWVRFGIVPPASSHLDAEAQRSHARYVLADLYGDLVSDWQVAIEDAPPGQASVVSAMRSEFMTTLKTTLVPANLRLVSAQAHLVVAFNAWRHKLPADNTWFVVLEDGWLAAVHLLHGKWHKVHMARLSRDSMVELERIQAFRRLTLNGGESRMFIEAPPRLREHFQHLASDLEWLEPAHGETSPTHELGLLLRAQA